IARALVSHPEAILCDEPTGNLDTATSRDVLALLRSLPDDGKRSVVMVTHDPTAAAYGDRLAPTPDGPIERIEPRAEGSGQESGVRDEGSGIRGQIGRMGPMGRMSRI